jgi:hypothetical protein
MIRIVFLAALLTCATALGQAPTPAKPLAFDVVSIRPAKSNGGFFWMTTPDGYSVPGQSLFYTIMIAYFPQGWFYWSKDRGGSGKLNSLTGGRFSSRPV